VHAKRFREAAPGTKPKQLGIISTKTMSKAQINDLCSSCHAKMMLLTTSFGPGDRFFDHFDLVAWESPDYHPDGRDLGENYTATSYRSSACVKSGKLDCMHCHTSSGKYRFTRAQANNACLPCHSEKVSDAAEHSRHKAGGEGSQCVSCHMPTTEFARMRRTDHSMHPPAPAATVAFKSPNACNLCHAKETPAWADQKVRSWHQHDYQAPGLRRGGLIAGARRGDWTRLKEMLAELEKAPRDEVFATSLLRLIRNCGQDSIRPTLLACLKDGSPLVRASAVEALGDRLDRELVPILLPSLQDDFRLVRVRAAAALAGVPEDMVADREPLSRALAEYESGMLAMPDDAMAHYNLGNYHMQRDKPDKAAASFETSLKMQSNNVPALVNASLAYSQLGQNEKALASLRTAVKLSPTNAPAQFNLGLLLGELGRTEEAEAALRAAVKYDPQSPQAAYNLAVILAARNIEEAISWCRHAATLRPAEPKYAYTMAFYLQQSGSDLAAMDALRKFIEKPSYDPGVYGLLGQLLERHSQTAEAIAVYRIAAGNELLSEADRSRFGDRGRELSKR
jgi:tetratricopeptide (TPR) repeat protein